ncbi:MAG: polyribonucleotide nucleotidyltransferase [Dehalococcoidales bacterium]|nr:MAG: polyribonucleotide nucleotidyltransferase [Dehalococcoidales bacterium]
MLTSQSFNCDIGGRNLVIETGKLAEQATAAATVHYGDTVVLVTLCVSDEPREGADFLPLTIDYEERLYAVGKIPGGWIRREGRPSQEATLACRLTDRPIRPLLPKAWRKEIQIVITVLSADQENNPDILAIIGSSAVLSLSEVPFDGPVSAVRIGYIDNELILNPTLVQVEESQFDLVVASTRDKIVMLEAGAQEVPEDIISQAIGYAHEANQSIINLQEQLQRAFGKPKVEVPETGINPDLVAAIPQNVKEKLAEALTHSEKGERDHSLSEVKKELMDNLGESFPEEDVLAAFDDGIRTEIRASLLNKGQRISGRGLTEIRPLGCEVGLLPRTHGSALFTRGQTQVLTITTLGPARKEQPLDGLGIEESKRFMHHYNFTPFSTGEVRRIGTPSRREIGHGALVERSLEAVLPKDEDFPYTIRLVSEVLSSSGSTSMASTCASSLSLMDAGIPIRRAVAGIAMGLVAGDDDRYVILTDIEGMEDNYGDMDFKVAGTTDGITGIQMDTKLKGISLEITEKTLIQAHEARLFILAEMNKTISANRPELSPYAPRIYRITIPQDKIGSVIGPGGKTIRSISEETDVTIDIDNDGTVHIGAHDEAAARKAITIIEGLTKEVEIGSIYTGKVTRLLSFGAFVEILPGKEGMVHISELANYRVANIEDEVKVGDEITVIVIKNEDGKIGLSRKAVYEKPPQAQVSKAKNSPSPEYPFRTQRNTQSSRNRSQQRR